MEKNPSRSFLLLIPLFFTVDTLVLIKCVNSHSSQCSLGPGNGGESNREERSAFIKYSKITDISTTSVSRRLNMNKRRLGKVKRERGG